MVVVTEYKGILETKQNYQIIMEIYVVLVEWKYDIGN